MRVTTQDKTAKKKAGYGRGARVLSAGIASTGLVTFAYFALASHTLSGVAYKHVTLLWSIMFVIVTVIYRPVEQLLSRTIADRRARGLTHSHPLRIPAVVQAVLALVFLAVALPLQGWLTAGVFGGSSALYWILVGGVVAYAVSYFARGWLAGHEHFLLYGGLVLAEACSRVAFPLAVVVGLASGQTAVALGIAAAPLFSLIVMPFASRAGRKENRNTDEQGDRDRLTLARGGGFAVSVLVIMLAEQTLLNAAVLTAAATATSAALAGFVFNALLIVRAPLQLFQAIQTSLLPHLAGLEATAGQDQFGRAIRVTVLAIAGFALAVSLGLLAIGPFAMNLLFGHHFEYARLGLTLIGVGMGFHLIAGTLNQAALARRQTGLAMAAWSVTALAFVAWLLLPVVGDQLLRAEIGYCGAAIGLSGLFALIYFAGQRRIAASSAAPATA